jgi:hypothetical protein
VLETQEYFGPVFDQEIMAKLQLGFGIFGIKILTAL